MPNFPPLRDCQKEYALLRQCAALNLDDSQRVAVDEATRDQELDLDLVADLAHWHCIAPLVYRHLQHVTAPNSSLNELQESYAASSLRYGFQSGHALEILKELQALGLKPIVLKGLALAEPVYKDPGLRSMGDLDIWLHGDEAVEADHRLRELGWFCDDQEERQEKTRAVHHHLPRLNSPDSFTSVEIHHHLHELDMDRNVSGYSERAEKIQLTSVDESGDQQCVETLCLGGADQLLALATHFSLDRAVYYQSYAALRQLTDIAEVARSQNIDWELVVELAEKQAIVPWAWLGLESAAQVIEAPIPAPTRAALQIQVPDARRLDQFIQFKVLEPSPWVLHQLVQPDERSPWSLIKALLRRCLWDPRYLDDKFGANARGAYRRHTSEMLGVLAKGPAALNHLRIDGWMAGLHAQGPEGTG